MGKGSLKQVPTQTQIAWGMITAVVLIVFCAASYDLGRSKAKADQAQRAAQQHGQYTEEYIKSTCVEVEGAALIECIKVAVQSSSEQQNAQYDLAAQEDMAQWTWWMLLTGLTTTAITAVGIYFVRETLKQATTASDVARELGEAQVRAYLSFEVASLDDIRRNGLGTATLVVRNTGQSPASNVHYAGIICPTSNSMLNAYKQTRVKGDYIGQTIPANSTLSFDVIGMRTLTSEMMELCFGDGNEDLLLEAVVVYRDVFKREVRVVMQSRIQENGNYRYTAGGPEAGSYRVVPIFHTIHISLGDQ